MLTPEEIDWIKDRCYPTRMETKVYLAEIARLAQIGRRTETMEQGDVVFRLRMALDAAKHALADTRCILPHGDTLNIVNEAIADAERIYFETAPTAPASENKGV